MIAPPRFSLNQITTRGWGVREAVTACSAAGIAGIGLWREQVARAGLAQSVQLVQDTGLRVSSLCRGGFFPAATAQQRAARLDDNRRAVEEAAELGAETLVLVCGGVAGRDLDAARGMVRDGIAELVPHAAEHHVRLGIEPLHPMVCADRSVVVTLAQANALAARFPAEVVGVVVDAYNVWWDPQIHAEIDRARGRIHGFQVADWLAPVPDPVVGRGMLGDGCIDLARMTAAVEAAGYEGLVEVEILSAALWEQPPERVLEQAIRRFHEHIPAPRAAPP